VTSPTDEIYCGCAQCAGVPDDVEEEEEEDDDEEWEDDDEKEWEDDDEDEAIVTTD
jgi:hypothetical protein